MDISTNAAVIFARCGAMNCTCEGQNFSRNLFTGVFADPAAFQAAITELLQKGLITKENTGAYRLTSNGATALGASAIDSKHRAFAKRSQQDRPPINKL